jgi:hypothetical protein
MERLQDWGKYILLAITGYFLGIYVYPSVRDYVMSIF